MESIVLFTGEWISGITFGPLLALLIKWSGWFAKHDLNLKRHGVVWEKSRHLTIHGVFLKNWKTVPADLRQALQEVVEMSTPEGHNLFIELAAARQWNLGRTPLGGWSCQDLAARAYVERHDIFEEARATQTVRETEKWIEYFDLEQGDLEERISDRTKVRLIERLHAHWAERHRGKYARMEMITVDGAPTFLIGHADLMRSFPNIRETDSLREIIRIHPELVDLVRFHRETGRLSVHTRFKTDAAAYRRLFGEVFWGDVGRYQVCPVYFGQPLLQFGAAVLRHAAEEVFTVRVREATLFQPSNVHHWLLLRGAHDGSVLENDLKRVEEMGLTGVKSLELGFKFAGERAEIPVAIKDHNSIRMPYTLGHTDAIFRYLILKTFMRLPKGGKR